MSWGAQNRSKDAKTPSESPAMSRKPKLAFWLIQRYFLGSFLAGFLGGGARHFLIPFFWRFSVRVRGVYKRTHEIMRKKHLGAPKKCVVPPTQRHFLFFPGAP
jgi:hypothetical protein